jgi:hypothetical protein
VKFNITIYQITANGTKDVCWNHYNSEWLGRAYTKAWAKRFGMDVISHVVHNETGCSANFVAKGEVQI